MALKPLAEDLENRRDVWHALASLFLDTDTSILREWRVGILAKSPYSLEQLERILIAEVYPVCYGNLFHIAGEWDEFDKDWLEKKIVARSRSFLSRFYFLARLTVPLSMEWQQTKKSIVKSRQK